MKKFLLFILMCLVIGASASAKVNKGKVVKTKRAQVTYKVENVNEVYLGTDRVTYGSTLNGNSVVEIRDNGYLMFVDNTAKKRYYVGRKCKARLQDLVNEVKKPKPINKGFLEYMMTQKNNTDYGSAGNVLRKPIPVYIDGVEEDKDGNIQVFMIE